MNFKNQLEEFAARRIARAISDLLGIISEENFVRLTYLAEKLTSDEEVLSGIRGIRAYLQDPNHPAKRLFHRLLDYLTPENRRKLFETLFYRGSFFRRKEEGCLRKGTWFQTPLCHDPFPNT
jgi:hypothetical protein